MHLLQSSLTQKIVKKLTARQIVVCLVSEYPRFQRSRGRSGLVGTCDVTSGPVAPADLVGANVFGNVRETPSPAKAATMVQPPKLFESVTRV